MTLASNVNNLEFATAYPIDKIGYEPAITSYVVGPTSTSTQTVTNPLGYACFITLSWSTDSVNYYPMTAYTSAAAPYTASGWVSASLIYLYMENNSAGSATFFLKYALDTIN